MWPTGSLWGSLHDTPQILLLARGGFRTRVGHRIKRNEAVLATVTHGGYREQRQGHVYSHRTRRLPEFWERISIENKYNLSTYRSIFVSTERRWFFAIPSNLHCPAAVIITSTVSFYFIFFFYQQQSSGHVYLPPGRRSLPFAPDDVVEQDTKWNFCCTKRIGWLMPPFYSSNLLQPLDVRSNRTGFLCSAEISRTIIERSSSLSSDKPYSAYSL